MKFINLNKNAYHHHHQKIDPMPRSFLLFTSSHYFELRIRDFSKPVSTVACHPLPEVHGRQNFERQISVVLIPTKEKALTQIVIETMSAIAEDGKVNSPVLPTVRTSGRVRKGVEKHNYDERLEKKVEEFVVPKGAGMCLENMERVADKKFGTLGKKSRNEEFYQELHKLFYGRRMKRMDVKKNVLAFSGVVYDGKTMSREKQFERVYSLNASFLKDCMDYLDIDRSTKVFGGKQGDKEALSTRLVDWCERPYPREGKSLDDLMPKPKRQKKKSKVKPKKPTKDPNAPKKALSSFLAFSSELRPKITAEMPELKLTEVATELGRRWKALSDGEKQPFVDMAKKDKERYEAEMEQYVVPKEFRKKKKMKKGATKRGRASSASSRASKKAKNSATSSRAAPLFENSRFMLTKDAVQKISKKSSNTSKKLSKQAETSSSEEESEEDDSVEESVDGESEGGSESDSSGESDDEITIGGIPKAKISAAIRKELSGSNLENLSVKKVRKLIEAEFKISLAEHKEMFKTMVLEAAQ